LVDLIQTNLLAEIRSVYGAGAGFDHRTSALGKSDPLVLVRSDPGQEQHLER